MMDKHKRMSWTTKSHRALVCETLDEANRVARRMLGFRRAIDSPFLYVSSQGGYVIYNEAGTKIIADR